MSNVIKEGQDEADGYAQLETLQRDFKIHDEAIVGTSYSDLLMAG